MDLLLRTVAQITEAGGVFTEYLNNQTDRQRGRDRKREREEEVVKLITILSDQEECD